MADKVKITLNWFPNELRPNARPHWREKAKKVKRYKRDCWVLAMQQRRTPQSFKFRITFYPPLYKNKALPDRDNCIAAFKAGQDGLAQAWGVDDQIFEVTYAPLGEAVPHGKIVIEEI